MFTGRFVCDFTVQLVLIILAQVVLFITLARGFNEISLQFPIIASTNFCDFTLIRRNSRN